MVPDYYRASWQNPKVLLTLALVFLCGIAAGLLTSRVLRPQSASAKIDLYWKEGGREISMDRFRKELALTAEQDVEITQVLDDFVTYYSSLQSQMDEVRASSKERISRVLTPEQRERFQKMLSGLGGRIR